MPTVPTYDLPQVAPSNLPGVQVQGLSPRVLVQGQENAMQTQQMGRDLQVLGSDFSAQQDKETMMANQVRVDAAQNAVRERMQSLAMDPVNGYLAQKGSAALDPNAQGQSLQDNYSSQLQAAIDEQAGQLTNGAQQRVFNAQAQNLKTQFDGQLQSHVLSEYKTYGLNTQKGTIDLAQNAALQSWDNPDLVDAQVQSAQAAVWKAGQINGDPGNLTEAKIQQTTSGIRSGVVQAALTNNNPAYAMAYMQQYKSDFTANDALKLQGMVRGEVQARTATSAAQSAMQAYGPAFQPTDMDRVLSITSKTESNNNPSAVGPDVPGQGTAKGIMQVMDATAKAPGYGIKPSDGTPGDTARVGKELMGALVQKYNGNLAQAWAAYNAGAGNVDKAVASAGPTGDWLTKLADYQSPANHAQTVGYVQKNMAAFQTGQGAPQIPSLQDIHQNIRLQPDVNSDPRVLSAALAEGTRMYNEALSDRKTQGNNAVTQAQQYLIQSKGDFNSLPPNLKEQVIQYAPDKWDQLQTFAGKVATPPTKTNMAVYNGAISDPASLAAMPDAEFNHYVADNFAPTDQKAIIKLRADFNSGKVSDSADTLNSTAIKQTLDNRLLSIGINPTPPASDLESRQRVGTIQKFINDDITATQQQLGRKMTQVETQQHIDQMFSQNQTFHGTLWGLTGGLIGGDTTLARFAMKIGDVPSGDVDKAKAALAAAGNNNPSNDQLLRWYWKRNQLNGN